MAEFDVDTSSEMATTVLRKRGRPVGASNEETSSGIIRQSKRPNSEIPQVQHKEVSQPVFAQTNLIESEQRDEATGVENPNSSEMSLEEEKADHRSVEMKGLKSKIALQHCSSSTDCLTELDYKLLYLDSQKKVEALTKENLELNKKLDEANEKMKGMVVIPKWAELNMDCLVNILGRLDMEMLLLDIPYVCKSWYKATCDPQCWSTLNFVKTPDYEEYPWSFPQRLMSEIANNRPLDESTITSFIKNVVKRSNGSATFVKLPSHCTQEAIVFISNECPNLKTLKLPNYSIYDIETLLPSLISKWKSLENLRLSWSEIKKTREILPQIRTHCNNFGELEIFKGEIGKDDASSIATYLPPNTKGLSLRHVVIDKVNLLTILNGCKGLEYLDARNCVGFDEYDADILGSAAHIPSVRLQGSTLYGDEDDYGNYCDCGISSDDDNGTGYIEDYLSL